MAFARNPETHERLAHDVELLRDLLQGKAKEALLPLAKKLMGKAIFENNAEIQTMAYNQEPIAAE